MDELHPFQGETSSTTVSAKQQLGSVLLNQGMITETQLHEALKIQKRQGHQKLLGEVLVDLGYIGQEQVLKILAESYGVPFVRVNPRVADPKVLEILPRDFLESQCVLPLFLVRDTLTVAVTEPANLFLAEEINRLSGHRCQLVASIADDIKSTLRQYLPKANVFVIEDIYEDLNPNDFTIVERQVTELSELEEVAGHSPVVKFVNYLLYSAVQEGASDIHIEPGDGTLRVRYRIDGRLFERTAPPPAMHPAIVSRLKIMSGLDISERRIPQDGDIHVMLDGRPVDLRVSTMTEKSGEKVVIRIIDSTNTVVGLERLGFRPDMLADWKKAVSQPNGVILVTGPTGSGKSTTLYSVVSELNSTEINISTVEDPVEANLKGINQFQVHEKAGFGFPTALRALLRQDPDILMIGEIRDGETARIATQAALTGHLVLSTLHTNDAPSAITRLMNLGVEPYLVAAILRAVLAQRLVRKICNHCKTEFEPDERTKSSVEAVIGNCHLLMKGTGCSKCRNTGYSGRMGIFELLTPSQTALEAIGAGLLVHEIKPMLEKSGFTTLRFDGLTKAAEGLTTVEEVFFATAS